MTIRQLVAAELDRLTEENDGVLTPEMIVAAATPEDSPLHHLFEWIDTTAAHRYRLGQAGRLIRIVRKEYDTDADGQPKYVRVYTSSRAAGVEGPGYRRTDEVLRSPISEAILVRSLKREVAALRQKYEHLAEYGAIVRGELGLDAG
jgi:hypothetical protein